MSKSSVITEGFGAFGNAKFVVTEGFGAFDGAAGAITGSGALVAQSATIAGSGASGSVGSGAASSQSAAVSGVGVSGSTGAGVLGAQVAIIAGDGSVADAGDISGVGALASQGSTVSGAGAVSGQTTEEPNHAHIGPLPPPRYLPPPADGSGDIAANDARVRGRGVVSWSTYNGRALIALLEAA